MNHSDLIKRLNEAASHIFIASTGYKIDENGHSKSVNGNDKRRCASMANLILNSVIAELEKERDSQEA